MKGKTEEINSNERAEGFWGRHVKVVTFAICMALFLGFFGPFSFFRIRDCAREREEQSMPELDAETLIALFHDPSRLTMDRLRTYRGTWNTGDTGNTFTARFGHYVLLAFEDATMGAMTYCEVTSTETNETLDLLDKTSDPEAFFGKS